MLSDTKAAGDDRVAAAAELLSRASTRSEIRTLVAFLDPDADSGARSALLEAIGDASVVSGDFEEPVSRLVSIGDIADRPRVLRALGSTGTSRSARLLIANAAPFLPEAVSSAAFDALIRMTGRDDLGRDHEAWKTWFSTVSDLEAEAWQLEMVRGLRIQNERLSLRVSTAEARTRDVYKRHFRVAPFQDRDGLLAEMLRSGDQLRSLGVELLFREISTSRQIGEIVGLAALDILGSADVDTRVDAARLIATLRPTDAGERLTRALEIENNPTAAKALLAACSRWPRVSGVQPALRWIELGEQTRDEAAALLLALDGEGLLTSPADRRRAAGALRAAGPFRLTPDGLRLLAATGNDEDREAIAALMTGRDESLRSAAATALARRPEFTSRILAAAAEDANLFAAAVTSTAEHRGTPSGYAALRELPAPSPESMDAGLLAVVRVMPVDDIFEVAQSYEPDPERQLAVLSAMGTGSMNATEQETINRGRLLLAEIQLGLSRPQPALATLTTLGSLETEMQEQADTLRVVALLWMNRIDEAQAVDAGADVWLDAIERIGDEPHAPLIADAALERFDAVLRDAERQRLRAISNLATADETPQTESNQGG